MKSNLIRQVYINNIKGFQDEVKDYLIAHKQNRNRMFKYEYKRLWEIESPSKEKRIHKKNQEYFRKKEQVSFYVRYILSKNKIPVNNDN